MSDESVRRVPWDEMQRAMLTQLVESTPDELATFFRRPFDSTCFSVARKPIVDWMLSQYNTTRRMPGPTEIDMQFPAASTTCLVPFGDRDEYERTKSTLAQAAKRLRDAHFMASVVAHLNQMAERYNDTTTNVDDLWNLMQSDMTELSALRSEERDESSTLADAIPAILEDLEMAQAGRRWGIPLPMPFFYHATMGGQPGDVTIILGRPGIGKTFLALMCLVTAITGNPYFFTPIERAASPFTKEQLDELTRGWRTRTLITSMEMPIEALRRRIAALITKIAYPQIRSGRFAAGNEEKFRETLQRLMQPNEIGELAWIAGGLNTPADLFASANAFDAKLVIVDGFYLMGGAGEKRWEIVQANLALIRRHARDTGRHFILVSQIDSNSDRIAFSQAIEQDASNILSLYQTAQEKGNETIRMLSKKVRDGTGGEEYLFNWSVTNARFNQERPAPRVQTTRG